MATSPASADEIFQFVQMMEAGSFGRPHIAKVLKRSAATVQGWMTAYVSGRLRRTGVDQIVFNDTVYDRPVLCGDLTTPPPVGDGPRIDIQEHKPKPKKKIEPKDIGLVKPESDLAEIQKDVKALWNTAENLNESNRKKRASESEASVYLGDGPVAISFISDQHIEENGLCDLKTMREDAELVRDTPGLYALLGGDGVNNHIKHRGAILASRSRPDSEWLLYDHYLNILNEKLLGVTSGNHDLWTLEFGGVDMVKRLAESKRLFYAPHQMYIDIRVGTQVYKIAMRHQYRYNSSFNQIHAIHRWYDMGAVPFDIGVICHHHEACIGQFSRHGRQVWGARPGSYQLTSNYAETYGYNRSVPTCPTFILHGDEHRVVGYEDIRVGSSMLSAMLNAKPKKPVARKSVR